MSSKVLFFSFVLIVFCLYKPFYVFGTEMYAEKTGKDCSYCHKSEIGGGELTKNGIAYKKTISEKGLRRIVRFVIYYIHLLFAIMWFGTILYVHIILKPGYAAKGLPKGELFLGWLSIIVMLITGVFLTIYRFSNLNEILSTRFGLILLFKILFFALMVVSALFVTTVLGPKMRRRIQQNKASDSLEFYDGKDGKKAYVGYNGKIFDVTESKLWKNGIHMGRHHAGADMTEALKQAPHKEDVLLRFPEANVNLVKNTKEETTIKVFYFIAYTNLAFVFIIIFLITLWKW